MEGSTRKGNRDISQTVTSKKGEESLKQMKTICKKISVSILTLLMIMTMYLSGSGESLFLKNSDVKAFTGEAKLVMSQALSSNKISEIDRPASEGLWSMTADGRRVFWYCWYGSCQHERRTCQIIKERQPDQGD